MANEKVEVLATVSPGLHPESVSTWAAPLTIDGKPHAALTASKAALGVLYQGLADCENAVTTTRQQYGIGQVVDGAKIGPTLPEDRANQLAADLGVKFSSVARTFDQHLGVVTESIENLTKQIGNVLTQPKRDAVAAAEASDIRKFVAALPDDKRMNRLHNMIEAGEIDVVRACIASPWAAGLDRANAETIFDLASQKFAPTQRAQWNAAKALREHLVNGSKIFVDRFRKIAPTPKEDSPAVAASKKLRA